MASWLAIIAGMDIDKINATVQPLLDACLESDDPTECLHRELDQLRSSGIWLDAELKHLQLIALQVLKEMVEQG